MAIIRIRNLNVTYNGRVKALENVNLDVEEKDVVSIIGPSGCGKTTLANIVLGLIIPGMSVSGSVEISGLDILGNHKHLERVYKEIGVGYVTQVDTLLPWRTLIDNVTLPCKIRGIPMDECTSRARGLLEMVGLRGFENMYPHQLSGGMRQRAQLIRALVTDPKILVMDEPFGALDALTRVDLQEHLTRIIATTRKTVMFITHDLDEAITISTKVVVMSRRPGRIKAVKEIPFNYPRDPFELRSSPEFEEVRLELWNLLSEEVTEK